MQTVVSPAPTAAGSIVLSSMDFLSNRDAETMLSSLAELNADLQLDTLPARLFGITGKLIANDVISFDSFDYRDNYCFNNWNTRPDILTPEKLKSYPQYAVEDVLIPEVVGRKSSTAVRTTDITSRKEFEKTDLYNEYYRDTPFKYQMGIALPISDDLTLTCGLSREAKDFTERDKAVLTRLAPHLKNAIGNTFEHRRLSFFNKPNDFGFLILDVNGKVTYSNQLAKQILKKYFAAGNFEKKMLPGKLGKWLKEQLLLLEFDEFHALPSSVYKVEDKGAELHIRLMKNNTGNPYTLILEEKKSVRVKLQEALSLTGRQTETVFWIMQGKTNHEIAEILNISSRTVQKHIQYLYDKMGVENRRAAISRALEIL